MNDVSSGSPERPSGKGQKESGPREGQATRRTFTDAYKLRIVGEYDALTEPGARGALLRREGLYDTHIGKWRRARDRRALGATAAPGPAKASPESAENRRLKAENARLAAELAKTKAVLEVMGKVHALLEDLSERAD
jgi:transposase-like protein